MGKRKDSSSNNNGRLGLSSLVKAERERRMQKPDLEDQVKSVLELGDEGDALVALHRLSALAVSAVSKRAVLALLERPAGAATLAEANGEDMGLYCEGSSFLRHINVGSAEQFLTLLDNLEASASLAQTVEERKEAQNAIKTALQALKCLLKVLFGNGSN